MNRSRFVACALSAIAAYATEGCTQARAPAAKEAARANVETDAGAPVSGARPPQTSAWRKLVDSREQHVVVEDAPSERALQVLIDKQTFDWECAPGEDPRPPEARTIMCTRGSFVRPNAKESACIVGIDCHEHRAGHGYSKQRLVVFEAEHVELAVDVEANILLVVGDVDGDGTDELILRNGYAWQGVSGDRMTLASLAGRRVTIVERFQFEELDTCGTENPGATDEEPAFFARMVDARLQFREELNKRECTQGAPWSLEETRTGTPGVVSPALPDR